MPGYHCSGKDIVNGCGVYCLNVGGVQIDQAVVDAFLKALTPPAIEATQLAVQQLEADHDAALAQWRLAVERARYEAARAERQYRVVEPENRLVARGLETECEKRLCDLAAAEASGTTSAGSSSAWATSRWPRPGSKSLHSEPRHE